MKKNNKKGLRTWIEIDFEAVKSNFQEFKKNINRNTKLCSVVKSNAYGHSLIDFSKEMERLGVDWLAVDSIVEGLRLRKEGIEAPILVLGHTLPEMFLDAVKGDISVTIGSFNCLEKVVSRKDLFDLKIHLKFDTGMNRQGFKESDLKKVLNTLNSNKDLKIEGLYTHFANAKKSRDRKSVENQMDIFRRMKDEVFKAGFSPFVHVSATSTVFASPEMNYDMVRVGIGMYGLWPSDDIKKHFQDKINLKRVLSWYSIVSDVKEASSGSAFGYGFTEKVSRDTRFAVIPIGYWHGYSRSLSSLSSVLIRGKRAKVLGIISMDILVVDVTDIEKVNVGDTVTLIGVDGEEEVTVEELAEKSGTTKYEMITRINPLIKRYIIKKYLQRIENHYTKVRNV